MHTSCCTWHQLSEAQLQSAGSMLSGPESSALQVRDEYRTDYDAGRGGYGNILKQELEAKESLASYNMSMYNEGQDEEL